MSTYARQRVAFTHGRGCWLWDEQGNEYLDALGGIAVCVLGHAHEAVARTIAEQGARLVHTSNLYEIAAQSAFAEKLMSVSGMQNVFFCNSGAEANEAALKLARLHGHAKGIEAPAVVVVEGAFHGRTLATLSASGNKKVQAGFEPLVPGFVRIPFDDLDALREVGRTRRDVAAVLVEPILGEGGIVAPAEGYLAGVREICDANGWLMMLDEIQTGMARTGKWFAWQHSGAAPDVMTLAKGMANGIPIGACLARDGAASLFSPGMHGSTFGGNPFACAVASTVFEIVESENLGAHASRMGARLAGTIARELIETGYVKEVRGKGFMVGLQMNRPCAEVVALAHARGLLVNVTADSVVRLLPPLIATEAEVDEMAARLCDSIKAFHNR